jgi:hypothetical protein
MAEISIKHKKLFRAMRDHGVSKKKAKGVLKEVSGAAGKKKGRGHEVDPVSVLKHGVHHLVARGNS